MSGELNLYHLLGISRFATDDEVRRAYRQAALIYHPDQNLNPGDTQRFIDLKKAYETLIDPDLRSALDAALQESDAAQVRESFFSLRLLQSRKSLLRLPEPQIQFALLELRPSVELPDIRPPINLCLVIDRSTSMGGERLDQVRDAVLAILRELHPSDSISIIAFSDRAEVLLTPSEARQISLARARLSMLQTGGGTEIGQGLLTGFAACKRHHVEGSSNHLILFTDGRTYGDEAVCRQVAHDLAQMGIPLHAVGIGDEWGDRLLDALATITGGQVTHLAGPGSSTLLLERILSALGSLAARRLELDGELHPLVRLLGLARLSPAPLPLEIQFPVQLGQLPRAENLQLLFEFQVEPTGDLKSLSLGHFVIGGQLLGGGASAGLPLTISAPITDLPQADPPPPEIVRALHALRFYQMQEKAQLDAEKGDFRRAATRLEQLATHLLASGEHSLAQAALGEASRLTHTQVFSEEGAKKLKYGTRALLLPGKDGAR